MEIQSVEAAELTRNILIDWIPIFEDKQVEYDIDIPEHPVRVRLDMDSYMRIVNNLIQNVIAHSHADKIKIALSKKENNMELLLADNGVGIEKEDLKHIFERLYKCCLLYTSLAVWGVINLLEGYGSDNPAAKSQGIKPVSYTHLDVYKRQTLYSPTFITTECLCLSAFPRNNFCTYNYSKMKKRRYFFVQ